MAHMEIVGVLPSLQSHPLIQLKRAMRDSVLTVDALGATSYSLVVIIGVTNR